MTSIIKLAATLASDAGFALGGNPLYSSQLAIDRAFCGERRRLGQDAISTRVAPSDVRNTSTEGETSTLGLTAPSFARNALTEGESSTLGPFPRSFLQNTQSQGSRADLPVYTPIARTRYLVMHTSGDLALVVVSGPRTVVLCIVHSLGDSCSS